MRLQEGTNNRIERFLSLQWCHLRNNKEQTNRKSKCISRRASAIVCRKAIESQTIGHSIEMEGGYVFGGVDLDTILA